MNPFLASNLKFVLKDKKILLGITGSIAAFKACDIVRFLRSCGAEVRVVLTRGAENFVTRVTLETLSGNPVLSGFWNDSEAALKQGTHHIDTARWADLILVAPATAHFIGKMAQGLADDLLSTELLAFQGTVLIAPAMNPTMYAHPAVQHNVSLLKQRGVKILGPTQGVTSCGEEGLGRMIEPEEIVEKTASVFRGSDRDLNVGPVARSSEEKERGFSPLNKKVIVTLGPTQSPLDPVRFISNRSSGLMGAALCWAAFQKGYQVTAICGPMNIELPSGVEVIRVQTAREMAEVAFKLWPQADVFISAAAVLDWDVKYPASSKLKKENGPPSIELAKNVDILATVSQGKKAQQFVLGFAAETDNPVQNAIEKLRRKNCDAIFANDVSSHKQGFESELNGGWWITSPSQVVRLETGMKTELARKLVEMIERSLVYDLCP